MKNNDFIAVGDIVVDAFIGLEDAQVSCDINQENCTISMRFGDKIPYKSLDTIPAVGNSPNAAVAAARLGLASALVTNLGDDAHGAECVAQLEKEKMDTAYVKKHNGAKTNYHFVLQYGAERTILVKHEPYVYAFPQELPAPKWMYLSSIGPNTENYHDEIADYLDAHPDVKLAFQPGSFQMKLGKERLARIYKRADIFFCNKEEARRILGKPDADFQELLHNIHALGPKTVVITDGINGLTYFDGEHGYKLPMFPDPKPPVSRTGAGDATSSTVTTYLAKGYELKEAILRGPVNSMNVVQHIGAQAGLLSHDLIEEILARKENEYRIEEIF